MFDLDYFYENMLIIKQAKSMVNNFDINNIKIPRENYSFYVGSYYIGIRTQNSLDLADNKPFYLMDINFHQGDASPSCINIFGFEYPLSDVELALSFEKEEFDVSYFILSGGSRSFCDTFGNRENLKLQEPISTSNHGEITDVFSIYKIFFPIVFP